MVGSKYLFVLYSTWDYHYPSTVLTFVKFLARKHKVVHVGPDRSEFSLSNYINPANYLNQTKTQVHEVEKNIYLYQPMLLKGRGIKAIRMADASVLLKKIKRSIENFDKYRVINIIFSPYYDTIAKIDRHAINIYYALDHFDFVGDINLTMDCDIVWVISKALYDEKRALRTKDLYLIECFVDPSLILQEPPKKLSVFDQISFPVVGYFGRISETRLDLEFYFKLVHKRPDIFFAMYGFIDGSAAKSIIEENQEIFGNFNYYGSVPLNTVHEYIGSFDIGIVPYLNTEFNRKCNPSKVFEYLAAGLPVLSTDLPFTQLFGKAINVYQNLEDCSEKIDNILKYQLAPKPRETRLEFARDHTSTVICKKALQTIPGYN